MSPRRRDEEEEDEGSDGEDRIWPFWLLAGLASGLTGYYYLDKYRKGKKPVGIGDRIIEAARRLATPIPPLDYVGIPDPRWVDEVLGGSKGPGKWQWYEAGFGTTCAVFATAVLQAAGAQAWTAPNGESGRALLNRPPPIGVGFVIGDWAGKFAKGGDLCDVRRLDPNLQPGDLYYVVRDGDPAKWHVGFVLERRGNKLVTCDGGQTAPDKSQCVRIMTRQIDGKKLTSKFGTAEIQWRLTWPAEAA